MSARAELMHGRRQRRAAPGSAHDRGIRIARIVLPVAIGALAAVLAIAPLTMGRDISFVLSKDRVAVAHERMRVSRAVYRGADEKGRPFRLTAVSAVQHSSRDTIVDMKTLSAEIALDEGPSVIRAPNGRYDMTNQRVMVDGPVSMVGPQSYRVDTRDVTVDLKTKRARSAGAVEGSMALGTFSANRLEADLTARTVVLDGRARLHIVQGRSRGRR